MEDDGQRRIRPALWVVTGVLMVPVALLMGLDAAATVTRVGGSRAPLDARASSPRDAPPHASPSWTTKATPEGPG
jgi:hypothetical protein